jgi:hypothetical protein
LDEAYKAFKTTRAETSDAIVSDEHAIRQEFKHLQGQIIHERQLHVGFADLFKTSAMRKRCVVGFLTMFGAQGTATLVINSKISLDSHCVIPRLSHLQIMDRPYTRVSALTPSRPFYSNLCGSPSARSAIGSMPYWLTGSVE